MTIKFNLKFQRNFLEILIKNLTISNISLILSRYLGKNLKSMKGIKSKQNFKISNIMKVGHF